MVMFQDSIAFASSRDEMSKKNGNWLLTFLDHYTVSNIRHLSPNDMVSYPIKKYQNCHTYNIKMKINISLVCTSIYAYKQCSYYLLALVSFLI